MKLYLRGKVWWVDYSIRGRRVQRSLRTRDREAAVMAAGEVAKVVALEAVGVRVGDPVDRRRELGGVGGRIDGWERALRAAGKNRLYVLNAVNEVRRAAAARGWATEQDITPEECSAYQRELLERVGRRGARMSAHTVNTYRGYVSAFLAWCNGCGRAGARGVNPRREWVSPWSNVPRAEEERGGDTQGPALPESHLQALLSGARPRGVQPCKWDHRRMVYAFWAVGGVRPGETEQVEVRDCIVGLRERVPRVRLRPEVCKSGRSREIPLPPRLADLVRARCAALMKGDGGGGLDGLVFMPVPRQGTWLRDLEQLGLAIADAQGRRYGRYSVRRMVGTRLALRDTPPAVTQALMGHRDIRTTMRFYVDRARMPVAAAVSGLAELLPEGFGSEAGPAGSQRAPVKAAGGQKGGSRGVNTGRNPGATGCAGAVTETVTDGRPVVSRAGTEEAGGAEKNRDGGAGIAVSAMGATGLEPVGPVVKGLVLGAVARREKTAVTRGVTRAGTRGVARGCSSGDAS